MAILEALCAFAQGEFLLAYKKALTGQTLLSVEQTDLLEAASYGALATRLLWTASIYYQNLCDREGPFLFTDIPVWETQRRFGAAVPYLLKALETKKTNNNSDIKYPRLVTLDDKAMF